MNNSSNDFADLGIAASLLKSLNDLGYEKPSPIQEQSIPLLLEGKNLLGTAQTGTGKTAAFGLPLLSRLKKGQKTPQILVLTPTRELAIQVSDAFKDFSRYMAQLQVLPVYGGQGMYEQLRALRSGVQVVVGTPGRILDHLRRGTLNLTELSAVVLDEADEMLRMGFIEDVETILSESPEGCQRALFSATMPPAIRRVADKYLGDAEEVRIAAKTQTVEKVEQKYLLVRGADKLDALSRILEVEDFNAMIIFVRTKTTTVELAERLKVRGFEAAALNGDLSQVLRERTIDRLKRGDIDILVATDVAARGLDVDRISHVFNYDIPYDTEAYIHRIGRTGRAGRHGTAILFVTPQEKRLLKGIERVTRQPLSSMDVPTGTQISAQRVSQFQQNLQDTLVDRDLEAFRRMLSDFGEHNGADMADVAAALAFQLQQSKPLFPRLKELTVPLESRNGRHDGGRRDRKGGRKDEPRGPMESYRLNLGRRHQVTPKDIVGAFANEGRLRMSQIGRIALYDSYCTVDLPKGLSDAALRQLQSIKIRQQPVKIRPYVDSPPSKGKKPYKGKEKGKTKALYRSK